MAAYYLLLYFPDRYLMSPYIDEGTHRGSYNPASLLGVMAVSMVLIGLLLLGPFLAGRINRKRWAAWGCAAFGLNLAAYALASLPVSLAAGDLFIHTGVSLHPYGFYDILHLVYVIVLYGLAAWLGSLSAWHGARARVIRRTRRLALG